MKAKLIAEDYLESSSQENAAVQPEGDWPGKSIDWQGNLIDAKLIVELPFWLAVPNGEVTIILNQTSIQISIENKIVGIFYKGVVNRDERYLMHLTAEGFPFSQKQAATLAENPYGQRHYRTTLIFRVKCLESVANLLSSTVSTERRDALLYLQTLAFGHIEFINLLIDGYRMESLDPFVSKVSYWDVPLWHISTADSGIQPFHLVSYPVTDDLPRVHRDLPIVYRTTIERVQESVTKKHSLSLDELLNGWTDYYHGRYAEGVRKAVTAIEVALAHLLSKMAPFDSMPESTSSILIRKMKFREQLDTFCKSANRRLPGPLTHFAPEVNGVRLEEELFEARELRHKLVHESHRIDYRDQPYMLRIMETLSWLHGWLYQKDSRASPTNSSLYSIDVEMAKLKPFDYELDNTGVKVLPLKISFPSDEEIEESMLSNVYVRMLLAAATSSEGDREFCVAWAFEKLRIRYSNAPKPDAWNGPAELFFCRIGHNRRPVFLVRTAGVLNEEEISSISCRTMLLDKRKDKYLPPLIVVEHLNEVNYRERSRHSCLASAYDGIVSTLNFTVISFNDYVMHSVIATLYPVRQFGFLEMLQTPGLISGMPISFEEIGSVRTTFSNKNVVSITLKRGWLQVGDELAFNDASGFSIGPIISIQRNRIGLQTAFASGDVGVVLNISATKLAKGSIVHKIRRPRLIYDASVTKRRWLKNRTRPRLAVTGKFSQFTAHGMYDWEEN